MRRRSLNTGFFFLCILYVFVGGGLCFLKFSVNPTSSWRICGGFFACEAIGKELNWSMISLVHNRMILSGHWSNVMKWSECFLHLVYLFASCRVLVGASDSKCGRFATKRLHWKGFLVGQTAFSPWYRTRFPHLNNFSLSWPKPWGFIIFFFRF